MNLEISTDIFVVFQICFPIGIELGFPRCNFEQFWRACLRGCDTVSQMRSYVIRHAAAGLQMLEVKS